MRMWRNAVFSRRSGQACGDENIFNEKQLILSLVKRLINLSLPALCVTLLAVFSLWCFCVRSVALILVSNVSIAHFRYNSFLNEERRKRLNEKLAKKDRKREKKRKKLLKAGYTLAPDLEVRLHPRNCHLQCITLHVLPTGTYHYGRRCRERRRPAIWTGVAIRRGGETPGGRAEEKSRPPHHLQGWPWCKATKFCIITNSYPVFPEQINVEFDALVGLIDGKLNPQEQTSLEELHKFMLEDEGSWVLGENFLCFIGKSIVDIVFISRVYFFDFLKVVCWMTRRCQPRCESAP